MIPEEVKARAKQILCESITEADYFRMETKKQDDIKLDILQVKSLLTNIAEALTQHGKERYNEGMDKAAEIAKENCMSCTCQGEGDIEDCDIAQAIKEARIK